MPWTYRGPQPRKAFYMDPDRAGLAVALLETGMKKPELQLTTLPTEQTGPLGFADFTLAQALPWPMTVEAVDGDARRLEGKKRLYSTTVFDSVEDGLIEA